MAWILLSAGSAAFIGIYEVFRKAAVGGGPALLVLFFVSLGGLCCLLPVVLLAEWQLLPLWDIGLQVRPMDLSEHFLVILKSALVSSAWALSYFAIAHLPISVAGPLRATSPVLTVALALLLFAEQPTPGQWMGMAVIFLGHLGFARLGRSEGIHYRKDRWILLLALGTIVGSLSGLYDKHLLQAVRLPPTTLQFWFCVYNVLLQGPSAWISLRRQRRLSPTRSTTGDFSFLPSALCAGVLLVLADQLYMRAVAMDGALISVVSLTRRSSILVSFTVGGLLFRERLLKRKAWPLLLILVGLFLLVSR